jgi:transcriptional regulator with XRE-family HTH domain
MVKSYTREQVVTMLRKKIADTAGSQAVAAGNIGVSPQYLSDVLFGRRWPGVRVLEWLNLEERADVYVPKSTRLAGGEK